jgi:hypothetical protein
VVTHIKITRIEWAASICRMDGSRTPRKIVAGKIYLRIPVGEPQDWWLNSDQKRQNTTGENKIE